MKRLAPVITGFMCAALVVAAGASPSEAAVRKVALGVSMTGANGSTTPNIAQVDAFTTEYGRKPAIWSVWSTWGDVSNQAFPTTFLNQLKSRGIVPMVFWQPTGPSGTDYCANWSQQAIIDGKHDTYIRNWATAAKNYGGKVILRFEHEMNAYWFPWGLGRCTNTVARMIEGWRHVWRIVRQEVQATNVKFLWSIYGKNNVAAIFPGAEYVDYMGLSAFNWAKTGPSSWKSMVSVFSAAMGALLPLSTKPIIAGEVGTRYMPECSTCDKAAWIANGYPAVYNKWPRVKAIVYFNVDMSFNSQPDWRLTTPPAAKTAYMNLLTQRRFQGSIPPCPSTGPC